MQVGQTPPSSLPPKSVQVPRTAPAGQLLIDLMTSRGDVYGRQCLEALAVGGGAPALFELYTRGADGLETLQGRAALVWQALTDDDLHTWGTRYPSMQPLFEDLDQLFRGGRTSTNPASRWLVSFYLLALFYGGLPGLHATAAALPHSRPGNETRDEQSPVSSSACTATPLFRTQSSPLGTAGTPTVPTPSLPPPDAFERREASLPTAATRLVATPRVPPFSAEPSAAPCARATAAEVGVPAHSRKRATPPSPASPDVLEAAATLFASASRPAAHEGSPPVQASPFLAPRSRLPEEPTDATSALRHAQRRSVDLRGTPTAPMRRRRIPGQTTAHVAYASGAQPRPPAQAPAARTMPRPLHDATQARRRLEFPGLGMVELAWPDLVSVLGLRLPDGYAPAQQAQVRINGIELRMATGELRSLLGALQSTSPLPSPPAEARP